MRASTTLADSFTPLLFADLSSAVRASRIWWPKNESDDGVAHGRQAGLRWWPVDSFFSAPLWQCGGAVPVANLIWLAVDRESGDAVV